MRKRVRVLSAHIATLIDDRASVLDVGAGSGEISLLIKNIRPDIEIRAIDVLVRADCAVPVQSFDGRTIPYPDGSFDDVLLLDVLHHATEPMSLLEEAVRVARKAVIIKDHNCNTPFNRRVMKFTDWFGNRQYGVPLPYNFWSFRQWQDAWTRLAKSPSYYSIEVGLYPKITRILFAKDMDFIARVSLGN